MKARILLGVVAVLVAGSIVPVGRSRPETCPAWTWARLPASARR